MDRFSLKRLYLCAVLGCVLFGFAERKAQAQFNIVVDIDTPGLSTGVLDAFAAAEVFWESQIIGYQPGITITSVDISASVAPDDGLGGTLGFAGPTGVTAQGGFILPDSGIMSFDSADIDDLLMMGTLESVIRHEMGHVLGIGTLWTANGVYVNGSGAYTGANALTQYNIEYDAAATSVPVELAAGPGTNDAHWAEGTGLTVIDPTSPFFGLALDDELMTGFLSGTAYLSNTSLGSLEDIGYLTIVSLAFGDFNWRGFANTSPETPSNWIEGAVPTPADGDILGFPVNPNFDPIFSTFFDDIPAELGGIIVGPDVTSTIRIIDILNFEDGATFDNLGTNTFTFQNTVNVDGDATVDNVAGSLFVFESSIVSTAGAGPFSLEKTGEGTLRLLMDNTLPNGVGISGGTVFLGTAGSAGAGPIGGTGDSTVLINNGLTIANDIEVDGGVTLDIQIGDLTDPPSLPSDRTAVLSGDLTIDGILNANSEGFLNFTGDSTGSTGSLQVPNGTTRIGGDLSDVDLDILGPGRAEGTGTVMDLDLAGTLNPGDGGTAIGIFSSTGDATIGGALEINWLALGVPGTAVAGTDNDQLDVDGDVTLTAAGEIIPVFTNQPLPTAGDSYPVLVGSTITDAGVILQSHPLIGWTLDLDTTGPDDVLSIVATTVNTLDDVSGVTTNFFDDILGDPSADAFFNSLLGPGSTISSVNSTLMNTDSSIYTTANGLFGVSLDSTKRMLNRIHNRSSRAPIVSSSQNQSTFNQQMHKSFGDRSLFQNAASYSYGNLDAPATSNNSGSQGENPRALLQPTLDNFNWNDQGPKGHIYAETDASFFSEKRYAGRHIKSHQYGFLFGSEISDNELGDWAKWKAGLAFSLGQINTNVDGTATDVKDFYTRFVGYGSIYNGPWSVSMLVGTNTHWAETARNDPLGLAHGSYNAYETYLSFAGDYAFNVNKEWSLVPYYKLTMYRIARDGFNETGPNALSYGGMDSEAILLSYGLSINWQQDFMRAVLSLGGDSEVLQSRNNLSIGGLGASGVISGLKYPSTSFHMGSELDMQLTEWMEIFARYDLNASNNVSSHAVHLGARFLVQ